MGNAANWKSAIRQYYGAFIVLMLVVGLIGTFGLFPLIGPIWGRVVSAAFWVAAGWIVSGIIIRRYYGVDEKRWRKICFSSFLIWACIEIAVIIASHFLDTLSEIQFPEVIISKLGQCAFILMPAIKMNLAMKRESEK